MWIKLKYLHSPEYHSSQSSLETRLETCQALLRSSVGTGSFLIDALRSVACIAGGSGFSWRLFLGNRSIESSKSAAVPPSRTRALKISYRWLLIFCLIKTLWTMGMKMVYFFCEWSQLITQNTGVQCTYPCIPANAPPVTSTMSVND